MTIATTRTIKVKQFIPNYVYIDYNKYIIFGGFKPSQRYQASQPIIPSKVGQTITLRRVIPTLDPHPDISF